MAVTLSGSSSWRALWRASSDTCACAAAAAASAGEGLVLRDGDSCPENHRRDAESAETTKDSASSASQRWDYHPPWRQTRHV